MAAAKQNTYKSMVELVTKADTEKMRHKGSGAKKTAETTVDTAADMPADTAADAAADAVADMSADIWDVSVYK